jgi:hypothetical protein
MSRDPAYAETYPEFQRLDAETEEALAALGFRAHPPLTDEQLIALRAAHVRREAEDAAACAASDRYYLTTARGRLAAEGVDAAARAQLDVTKETA